MRSAAPAEPTLGDVLTAIAALLSQRGVEMPKREVRLWHELFYELKTMPGHKPASIDQMFFDWDGPYPRSRKLADFLQALHSTANVSAINPSYSKFGVPKSIEKIWERRLSGLPQQDQDFIQRAADLARERFI